MSKLLIVDDDVGVLRQLKWALDGEFGVFLASSKDEALQLIHKNNPQLVALDVNLSGTSPASREGLEILDEIKQYDPSIKVIMITANDSKDIALEAIAKGAFDYYVKPVDIEELKIILRRGLYIQNLEKENKRLAEELHKKFRFQDMIGSSPSMVGVFNLIKNIAPTEATVLITGESGTGKELVAKAIHSLSSRKDKPFVIINCGAIPENLLESELFGHEKGAFTDAYTRRVGKLEVANQGTVFLDEIGEMSLGLQVKILRFLQEKVIERVGSNLPIALDVRVIAATNSDLKKRIEQGSFREDLFYRLSVINIELPPLRERGEDILVLANYFFNKFVQEVPNKNIKGFSKDAKDLMLTYAWPGNVREIENRIHRATILAQEAFITPSDLGFGKEKDLEENVEKFSLKEARQQLESNLIKKALQGSKYNVNLAAKMLGVTRPTLYDLMKKYNIKV